MAERGVIKVVNFIRARIWIRSRVCMLVGPKRDDALGNKVAIVSRNKGPRRVQHGVRPAVVIMPRDTGSIRRKLSKREEKRSEKQ